MIGMSKTWRAGIRDDTSLIYEGKEKTAELGSTLASAARNGKAATNVPVMKPPSMYIDVRPALDNLSAAKDRMTMLALI